MNKFNLAVILIYSSILAGCATMAPITQEELGTINSVYIDFDFSEEIEYLHLGTTVFHERSISFDGTKIKADILNDIQNQIARKGYEISHSRESSDVIISFVPLNTYNPPSERGVEGYGFFNLQNSPQLAAGTHVVLEKMCGRRIRRNRMESKPLCLANSLSYSDAAEIP